ncbi:MAG: CPBP family intramembrane metalloprotease [Spirochaetia bacterium]|nr:CPBP family intramembrane metalloprotease [Spirochaetia bacterium]
MKKYLFILFLTLYASKAYSQNPYAAGFFAEIFPGMGHVYAGEYSTGFYNMLLIFPLAARYYVTTDTFNEKAVKANMSTTARNIFGFSVYDAYQVALEKNQRPKQILNIPDYSFARMYFAPFDIDNYKSLSVGIPLSIVAAISGLRLYSKGIHSSVTPGRALAAIPLILAQSLFIGMGEEAEFRGFQYPAFSELTRHSIPGNFLQSVSFGVCHTSWGACASPYVTGHLFRYTNTINEEREYMAEPSSSDGQELANWQYFLMSSAFGFYMGVITAYEKTDGLLKAITVHAMYDFMLIATDLLTEGKTGRVYLSFSLNF